MIKSNKHVLIGTGITLSGSGIYVLMGMLAKIASKHLSINHIVLLQSLAGFICVIVFMRIKRYHVRQIIQQHKFAYLIRILLSLASIYALIFGLQYVSIFNALVWLNSAPLMIPFLRFIVFKKKINFNIFLPVLLAFLGVALILSPDRHVISFATIMIVFSMLCMSFSLLSLEKMQELDPNLAIFYYFFYSSLLLSPMLMFNSNFMSISFWYLGLGILIGVLFFFIQLSIVYAARYISSQLISVLFYSEIIFSLIVSVLIEGIQLNSHLFMGIIFVIMGGVGVAYLEDQSLERDHQCLKGSSYEY